MSSSPPIVVPSDDEMAQVLADQTELFSGLPPPDLFVERLMMPPPPPKKKIKLVWIVKTFGKLVWILLGKLVVGTARFLCFLLQQTACYFLGDNLWIVSSMVFGLVFAKAHNYLQPICPTNNETPMEIINHKNFFREDTTTTTVSWFLCFVVLLLLLLLLFVVYRKKPDFENMTLVALRRACKRHKLDASGTHQELVHELRVHYGLEARQHTDIPRAYQKLRRTQLQALLRRMGEKTSGNKPYLVIRLVKARRAWCQGKSAKELRALLSHYASHQELVEQVVEAGPDIAMD